MSSDDDGSNGDDKYGRSDEDDLIDMVVVMMRMILINMVVVMMRMIVINMVVVMMRMILIDMVVVIMIFVATL